MTRNGKIARLPQEIRQQLNLRLANGEQGKQLVTWLNVHPEVFWMLRCHFGGRPITEQNLSEWKRGGFLDWQRHQEALDGVRIAAEQARELAEEAGATPLTDVLSASVTLLLMRLIREVSEAGPSTPESRKELQGLIRQWAMVRRGDQQAARLKMQQSEWATARAREAEKAAKEAEAAAQAAEAAETARKHPRKPWEEFAGLDKRHRALEWMVVRETMETAQRDSMMGMLCSDVGREKAAVLRAKVVDDTLERQQELRDEVNRALGNVPDPAESDPIAPDPSDSESTPPEPDATSC